MLVLISFVIVHLFCLSSLYYQVENVSIRPPARYHLKTKNILWFWHTTPQNPSPQPARKKQNQAQSCDLYSPSLVWNDIKLFPKKLIHPQNTKYWQHGLTQNAGHGLPKRSPKDSLSRGHIERTSWKNSHETTLKRTVLICMLKFYYVVKNSIILLYSHTSVEVLLSHSDAASLTCH